MSVPEYCTYSVYKKRTLVADGFTEPVGVGHNRSRKNFSKKILNYTVFKGEQLPCCSPSMDCNSPICG